MKRQIKIANILLVGVVGALALTVSNFSHADTVCKVVDKTGSVLFTDNLNVAGCIKRIVLDSDKPEYRQNYEQVKREYRELGDRINYQYNVEQDRQLQREIYRVGGHYR